MPERDTLLRILPDPDPETRGRVIGRIGAAVPTPSRLVVIGAARATDAGRTTDDPDDAA